MSKRYFLALAVSILVLIQIAPVNAAPTLSRGSTASYNLNATIGITQSCTANPPTFASQACTGTVSTTTSYVTIQDDGRCFMNFSSSANCRFMPSDITVPQGSMVVWSNSGILIHEVRSNQTLNPGLPPFDTGPIYPGSTSTVVSFTQVGTYYYSDPSYPGNPSLRGTVTVFSPPPPPAPTPTSIHIGLGGSVGWTVEGLSSSQVNLLVSHNVALSVSPIPIISYTPLTESGTFEQSINLSTRIETPGTASSLIMATVSQLFPALSGALAQTGGYGTGLYGPLYSTMLTGRSSDPEYTQWWVNGPLSNGSPVQILQGWSSVTGSETLVPSSSIGTRQAWIVTSQISQTVNVNIPNPNSPLSPPATGTARANLNLLWSFDKSVDLLLRNNDTLTLTVHSETPTTLCGINVACINASVIRDMAVTVNLTMQLSSTSLHLPASASNTTQNPTLNALLGMPWMPLGLAGLAAAVISGVLLWLGRRAKGAAKLTPIAIPNSPPAP